MQPGPYVMLAVGDTGQGMDAATRARVFEPFFTTKEQGKGSGLGLATVYGIVKQSGGYIWVYSEPGHGTVFKVYLPPAQTRAARRARMPAATARHRRQGWETVLLVEDEDAVRALAREVLRRHGYVVLEARHGVDALRVAERHTGRHSPAGHRCRDAAHERPRGRRASGTVRPKMKVLFMSGYTDHALMHRELTPGRRFSRSRSRPKSSRARCGRCSTRAATSSAAERESPACA